MPHMWVNGEKYVFSEHVIQKGIQLYTAFKDLLKSIEAQSDCRRNLEAFDTRYQIYEQAYVNELIVIERDARRFVHSILASLGTDAFFKAVGELNAVANTTGQGRQDFEPRLLQVCQLRCENTKVTQLQERVVRAY